MCPRTAGCARRYFPRARDWLSCTPDDVPFASGVPSSSGDALLVHGVAGFVQGLKQRVAQIVFAHAGGDADVAGRELS